MNPPRLPRAIALVCAISLAAAPAPLAGQDPATEGGASVCDCTLEVELVATLEDRNGAAGLSRPLVVERTSDGRYLVVPGTRQGAILLFSESGRFQRLIGGPGPGPREFGVILAMRTGQGDSTLVMDAGNRRLAVLDPDLNVARTDRLPVTGGWFDAVGDGRILILTGIPGRNEERDRLVLLNRDLTVERSFLRTESTTTPDVAPGRRRMAASEAGLVAVSRWSEYVVELWRIDGTRVGTIRREPEWFAASEARDRRSGIEPPPPVQEAPRIDPRGRLWTLVHVADEEWEDSLGPTRTLFGPSEMGLPAGNHDGYHDSVVEVLDVESGRLVASLRVDPHLTFISDSGHAFSYREDEVGLPFIDVWRFRVVER